MKWRKSFGFHGLQVRLSPCNTESLENEKREGIKSLTLSVSLIPAVSVYPAWKSEYTKSNLRVWRRKCERWRLWPVKALELTILNYMGAYFTKSNYEIKMKTFTLNWHYEIKSQAFDFYFLSPTVVLTEVWAAMRPLSSGKNVNELHSLHSHWQGIFELTGQSDSYFPPVEGWCVLLFRVSDLYVEWQAVVWLSVTIRSAHDRTFTALCRIWLAVFSSK